MTVPEIDDMEAALPKAGLVKYGVLRLCATAREFWSAKDEGLEMAAQYIDESVHYGEADCAVGRHGKGVRQIHKAIHDSEVQMAMEIRALKGRP